MKKALLKTHKFLTEPIIVIEMSYEMAMIIVFFVSLILFVIGINLE